MMQQYRDAKARHPGMVLLFRMGDFFETFEEDAELVSRVLGLTLTTRDGSIPMAGVPAKSVELYLRKLLHAGHRVAVCDQVEDAALAKGLVKREVTRVVTPGTVTEDELLDAGRPNHLVALVPGKSCHGLAWVEATTGEFRAADVPPERLGDELNRLNAAECLLAESAQPLLPDGLRAVLPKAVTGRPDWTFDPETGRSALKAHFKVLTLTGFGFDDEQACVTAAGALLIYLQETLRASLAHVRRLRPYRADRHLTLDEVTRRSLELTRTLRDGQRDGSLLSVLDRTVTAMGARALHDAVLAPLAEKPLIEARLEAVGEFLRQTSTRGELRDLLGQVPDLERLTTRVSTNRASPKDLCGVGRALRLLPKIKAKVAGRSAKLLNELEGRLELCPDLRELLDRALADDPPYQAKDGGVIREGYSSELDELRRLAREGKDWLARYQAEQITKTGIPSLKVGFNSVHGYYIEVTHAHQAKVPADYTRRQTLKNAERYITPELKEYEEKVLTAQERAIALEVELFDKVRNQIAAQTHRILNTAEVLAALDFLTSLAELAASRRYVRPMLVEDLILEIRDGRHPVLDQTLPPGTFVPNDVLLGLETGRFWLVTGPNMAGKSVLIKQTALIALMAHVGSFVPAASAKVGLLDRIFTRVGASDELTRGHSTFMVEMTEAANILNNATPRSLVILDEIGRGTSTYDGVSLAWAITEHLHDAVGCRAMFATHYHELAQLAETLPHLRNYNVQVREVDNDVVFLHKIAPGSAERSYGIHVARLAGVPTPVLERATGILAELEARHQLPEAQRRPVVDPPERPRKKRPPKLEAGPTLFEGAGPGN
jgi:DNA mismatch repair protein MutS